MKKSAVPGPFVSGMNVTRRIVSMSIVAAFLGTGCASNDSGDGWRYREMEARLICQERKCVWIHDGLSYCSC